MADLSLAEKRTLEQFFTFAGSNNWFVTHSELSELFDQHELSKHGYVEEGGSKSDRMRVVWKTCPNAVVSKLLLELLEIGFGEEHRPTDEWLAGYEECKGILQGLRFKGGEEPEIELARSYFQNQTELVLQDWNDAKLGIWVCQYMFGEKRLANKLLEKYRQGLTVMLILQESEYNRKLQQSHWRHMPCSVWWYPETDDGINHHKFCIVDGQVLWKGSFNFTWRAANKNEEEFTREPNLANVRQFSEEFTRLRRFIDEEERVRNEMF